MLLFCIFSSLSMGSHTAHNLQQPLSAQGHSGEVMPCVACVTTTLSSTRIYLMVASLPRGHLCSFQSCTPTEHTAVNVLTHISTYIRTCPRTSLRCLFHLGRRLRHRALAPSASGSQGAFHLLSHQHDTEPTSFHHPCQPSLHADLKFCHSDGCKTIKGFYFLKLSCN